MTAHNDGHTVARVASWPVLLLAAPAFVAVWSGWVGLGSLTGFGVIHPLPGIWDRLTLNTAITLPIGVEAYAAYALRVWLIGSAGPRAATFARRSAIGSLILGAAGQVAYHLMAAAGVRAAPWQITAAVACLPVAVLGMGAALAHLVRHDQPAPAPEAVADPVEPVREVERVEAAPLAAEPVDHGQPAIDHRDQIEQVEAVEVVLPIEAAARQASSRNPAPADVADLLLVGRAVAAEVEHRGDRLTRAVLIDGLHARGHRLSTTRAGELLAQLRAS